MPVSDALVVGEDWISEHYFTTDATKESFQARVLERRKEWDAAEGPTTRTRFTQARGDLEVRLVALSDEADGGDAAADLRELQETLLTVLGYRTGQWRLDAEGPLLGVSAPDAELRDRVLDAPLVVVRAGAVETVEDLLAKHAATLSEPWEREGSDPVVSVATALSTVMTRAGGPAYALVLAGRWALVAERDRWPEGRYLAVDLQLVAERNDIRKGGEIDRALTCLDAASLAPRADGSIWWQETLEASVKHTVGVSKDLQEGVRSSIEIIANDVVARRSRQGLDPLPDDQADELARQCLRYLYRILFLLYAEASPELGILPVGAGEYDAGYGLDRLRDLALTEIYSERAREGTHLYQSLDRLFVLVNKGHQPDDGEGVDEGLTFNGLSADLFEPRATALIDEVRIGNEALLQVLGKLLLTKPQKGRDRGFVSYVELGINQLGAVYEGLMSYTGSFAHEELYEVARNGDREEGSWVLPVTRSDHIEPQHFVMETDEETGERRPVVYRKGQFVFRLSGRDRQRSASYYTPEVLTRFTVQQALEELLDQDGRTTTAEEILGLTICEPALGSGAFAIEAVRQLAEEYLTRRQAELGKRIDPDDYAAQLQKVKAHIALHQVYGVDLNATAVELAEVSLWLDTMVAGLQAPWFGLRLRRGNSLVGARRALYPERMIKDKTWLTEPAVDEPLTGLAAAIDRGDEVDTGVLSTAVHHFLLPARGWGSALEVPKAVLGLVPDSQVKDLKAWRRTVRAKPTAAQIKRLQALALRVEKLWGMTLRRLRIAEAESSRALDLWGRPEPEGARVVTRQQIEASLADPDGAYRRLKLVMDAWCALWYWPLTKFEVAPPTVEQWISACEDILGHPDLRPGRQRPQETTLAQGASWDELNVAEELEINYAGALPAASVRSRHPWLGVCERVADTQAFFHWELEFATVFARGGFDLQVGNPPWVRPDVNVEVLLAEGDPWWALVRKASEGEKDARRAQTLADQTVQCLVLDGASEASVLAAILTDTSMYPQLSGRPDLYRGFISQVWRHQSGGGISGLIHGETHFTDFASTKLRGACYRRLARHWQFINELKLFDIQHQRTFGVNIYRDSGPVGFLHAVNLYHPDTIVRSLSHDGSGVEPGLKDSNGRWDVRPHRERIQRVTFATLGAWADVVESSDVHETPMVYVLNGATGRVLDALAVAERIAEWDPQLSIGWDESAEKRRGRLAIAWGRPSSWVDVVLQGSHLGINRPLYKMPNSTLRHNTDWCEWDVEHLGASEVPITKYKPSGDRGSYDQAYTHWGSTRVPAREFYRVGWRAMAANTGERTLIGALFPPGASHILAVNSFAFPGESKKLLLSAAVFSSILADLRVRSVPRSAVSGRVVSSLPALSEGHPLVCELILRTLRLNCLTDAYAGLWSESWEDGFASCVPILPRYDEHPVGPEWTADVPVRRAADRRNTQVEIDALVALMLGVPVDDLCTIYRTQFAVLYGYDHRDYTYDANGRLVPTEVLQRWRKRGEPQDDAAMPVEERTATHPGSGLDYVYELPFGTLDREADFRTAYAEFERRLGEREGC